MPPAQLLAPLAQFIVWSAAALFLLVLGGIVTYLFNQAKTNRDVMTLLQVTTATLSANHAAIARDVGELKVDLKAVRAAVEQQGKDGGTLAIIVKQQAEKISKLRCQAESPSGISTGALHAIEARR